MNFDATGEINKRYADFIADNNIGEINVPDFESIPIFGENIDTYMDYVRSNSILDTKPSNFVGKVMRKVNTFWFRPVIQKQDQVNDKIVVALNDFYKANEIKRNLNSRVQELQRKIVELEKESEVKSK